MDDKEDPAHWEAPVLVYGLGNPLRGDDGLGFYAVERLSQQIKSEAVQFTHNYQLALEDSLTFSQFKSIVLIDAMRNSDALCLQRVTPRSGAHYTSHQMDAAAIMYLCENLYQVRPNCFQLGIPGQDFEMASFLSPKAEGFLQQALQMMTQRLSNGHLSRCCYW